MLALHIPVFQKEKKSGRGYVTAAVRSAAPIIAVMRHQLDPREDAGRPSDAKPRSQRVNMGI